MGLARQGASEGKPGEALTSLRSSTTPYRESYKKKILSTNHQGGRLGQRPWRCQLSSPTCPHLPQKSPKVGVQPQLPPFSSQISHDPPQGRTGHC